MALVFRFVVVIHVQGEQGNQGILGLSGQSGPMVCVLSIFSCQKNPELDLITSVLSLSQSKSVVNKATTLF